MPEVPETPSTGRTRAGWLGLLALAVLLMIVSAPGAGLPPLVLPVGVVLAGVVLGRPLRWPWVAIAGLLAVAAGYAAVGFPPFPGIAIAVVQVAVTLAAAACMRVAHVRRLATLLNVFAFGGISVAAGAATAGAIAVLHLAPVAEWPFWWLTTSLSMALPAPGLLADAGPLWPRRRARRMEMALLLAAVVALTALAYPVPDRVVPGRPGYLLLPLLLWIGLRFGVRLVSAVATVIAAVLIGGELTVGWPEAQLAGWPTHLLTVLATVTGLLLLYGVAMQEEKRRLGERRLIEHEDFVRSLLSNSPALVAVAHYGPQGDSNLAMVSPTLATLLGETEKDLVGRSWIDVLGPAAGVQAQREDLQVLGSDRSQVFSARVGPRGRRRTMMATKFPLRLAEGGTRAVGMVALDVTEHRRLDRIMRLTFDLSPVAMARLSVTDADLGAVLDANAALGDLLGRSPASLRGADLRHFLHPDERDIAWSPDVARSEGRGASREVRLVAADGRTLWVAMTISVVHGAGDRDEDAFALAVMEDVTARHEVQQTLTYQAHHDALTGLPNRYALVERLDAALQHLWGAPTYVAVLFCDLDGFKTLNDTLSHRAGDEVLTGVAERLRGAVRPQDTVARLGGDEFVVIAADITTPGEAIEIGERLCASVRAPFRVAGREVGLSLSVGVATTTDPRASSEDLLRRADLAMYRAKDGGRNRVEVYVDTLEAAAMARMETQEYLRSAIESSTIHMEYQPIVALDGSGVSAVEALVRVPAPVPVSAAEFIEAAEHSGMMGTLGSEVLRLVLADIRRWEQEDFHMRVHLNVSGAQLSDSGFPDAVFEAVMAAGVRPGQLCFEVSDTPELRDSPGLLGALHRLHELGFHIGVDGFGAGHAGLTTVKELPADYVKIDRGFIDGITDIREDRVIVQAVVRVAHDLERRVIATGVETPAQMEALRGLGCDEVQGYVHSAPVRADRLPGILAPAG